jgi:phosphate transport system permease protein
MTSAIALLIAVPVSIGIALFLTDIAPRWTRGPIGIAVELLAAIPSIIYGMWGLFVFAPFMGAHVEPWMTEHLGGIPGLGALFIGPPIGIGLTNARKIFNKITVYIYFFAINSFSYFLLYH